MRISQAKIKKTGLRLLVTLLLGIIILSYLPVSSSEAKGAELYRYDRESYYGELIAKGFPADYAEPLSRLMTAHPNWSFEPLLVSELDGAYTFDYILKKETENPSTNLVYPSSEYSAFQDKQSGAVYDSGWYSANDAAVAYFIDPRNFLNEQDIFQFEDVRYYERDYDAGVESILSGTFMNGLNLENGKSVAENILSIGAALSVSPVHIAARIRQEQGAGGESGMISGRCGELLAYFYKNKVQSEGGVYVNTPSSGYSSAELRAYNGYYNFFNVGASGDGAFYIYLNAMKRAKKGTPEMAAEWGNGGAWNNMYKSIYGGAYSLKKSFVDDYQNTLYLQKFNIDPRSSRNFWGQYMQNVGAALSEGRAAYKSYKEAGILEEEFVFSIPVYSHMPERASADPSRGGSKYSPSKTPYTYVTHTDYPEMKTTENGETRAVGAYSAGEKIRVQGYSVHSYGTEHYEMSIDGGAFERISGYPRADVRDMYAAEYPESYDVNAYISYINADELSAGEHSIVIRAKTKAGSYYQAARFDITVTGARHDLDGDGKLSSADVTHLIRYLAGYGVTLHADGDINGDGRINNRDLIELIRIVSKA